MPLTKWLVGLLCLFFGPAAMAESNIPVFVSILPQKYFVEQIGGERVEVSVMVGPGHSPATYEPRPSQMAALGRAWIYFSLGALPFEQAWLEKFTSTNPQLRIVRTDQGIPLQTRDAEAEHETGHTHQGMDPHVWLSPPLAEALALNIRDALIEIDPRHAMHYQQNHARLRAELQALHRAIEKILEPVTHRRFMVFHASWGYFADTYGLEQIAIEAAGKKPGPKTLGKLIQRAKAENIRVIFVQQQFSRQAAETIAKAIHGQVVSVDPLAADYVKNLREVAKSFARAMTENE